MRLPPRRYQQQADQDTTDGNQSAANDADWLEYGAAELHRRKRRSFRPARYSVEAEFMQPPGWISRTSEGKFVLDEDSQQPSHPSPIYYQAHPPSAYPPSPVVESGVYRIGGDRTDRPRPTPILRRELSPQLGFPAVDSSARQLALRPKGGPHRRRRAARNLVSRGRHHIVGPLTARLRAQRPQSQAQGPRPPRAPRVALSSAAWTLARSGRIELSRS